MQHKPLHAGRLKSAAYDERERRLEITFADGQTRAWRGVPLEIARRFFSAPNPASFWEDRIAEEYPSEIVARDDARSDAASPLDALFRKPE